MHNNSSSKKPMERFGEQIPFCEPYWYQGFYSPYYRSSHVELRKRVRDFVEAEVKPNIDDWVQSDKGYPTSLHVKAYKAGVGGLIYPRAYGGTRPDDFDAFHEMILWDEIGRAGGGAVLWQLGVNSMALPPVINYGSDYLKDLVVRNVVTGKMNMSLAISEPTAGSDVANLQTTAKRQGDHYVINGVKKWITGGMVADYFTCAVRTGGPGMKGLSLILIPKTAKGLRVRKMKTQFDSSISTTMVFLDDVVVPVRNLIGKENQGFKMIVKNFNHERFIIACQYCRMARLAYEEAIKYALVRRTFGKRLVDHQIIRAKLGEMASKVQTLYANMERVAFQFSNGIPDTEMGPQCALLKVQMSTCFEYCAREASQIFGGSSIVREGRGKIVERLYREVRAAAIPGGSEEILLDFAIRSAIAKASRM